jgi:hypothetical protein
VGSKTLKPDIIDILKVAKRDSNTKRRFWCATKPTNFQLTDTNYTTTRNDICDKNPPATARPPETATKLPMNYSWTSTLSLKVL